MDLLHGRQRVEGRVRIQDEAVHRAGLQRNRKAKRQSRRRTHVAPVGKQRIVNMRACRPRGATLLSASKPLRKNPKAQHTAAAHLRQHRVLQNHAHAVAAQHAPPHAAAAQPAAAAHPRLLILLQARGWEGSTSQSEARRSVDSHGFTQQGSLPSRHAIVRTGIQTAFPTPCQTLACTTLLACWKSRMAACSTHCPAIHHLSHSHPHT